jgi:hypothetical protein
LCKIKKLRAPIEKEENILAKETRLKTLWTARLGHPIAQLPDFSKVFRAVRWQLRNAKFPKDADG